MFRPLFSSTIVWFEGVVEDRNDPLRLGRVRVRVIGPHTSDKQQIPTEELHWAQVIHPITSAALSGIGRSCELLRGTHVVGFFRDGEDQQDPLVLGSVPGIPQEAAKSGKGFNDPDGKYPLEEFIGEPDTNRLARNDGSGETIVDAKSQSRDTGVSAASYEASGLGDGTVTTTTFEEPETAYNSVYPLNKVYQSESGHVFEFDDTPDAERIHLYHRSGSFEEIFPDGSRVEKTLGNRYSVNEKDSFEHVKGNKTITVDKGQKVFINASGSGDGYVLEVGDSGNLSIMVRSGDVNLHVANGNVNKYVKGNVTEEISGNLERTIGGSFKQTCSSNTIEGPLHATQDISTDMNVTAAIDVFGADGTISLVNHVHLGNLSVNTSPPLPG